MSPACFPAASAPASEARALSLCFRARDSWIPPASPSGICSPVPSAASGMGGTEQLCLCPSALPRAAGHGTQHVASRFRNKRWRAGRPPPWRSGEDGAVAQAPPLHPHTPRTPALSAPLCPAPARARALHFQYLLSSAFDPFRLLTDSPAIKGNADLREGGAEDGVARCPAGFGFRAAAGRLGLI